MKSVASLKRIPKKDDYVIHVSQYKDSLDDRTRFIVSEVLRVTDGDTKSTRLRFVGQRESFPIEEYVTEHFCCEQCHKNVWPEIYVSGWRRMSKHDQQDCVCCGKPSTSGTMFTKFDAEWAEQDEAFLAKTGFAFWSTDRMFCGDRGLSHENFMCPDCGMDTIEYRGQGCRNYNPKCGYAPGFDTKTAQFHCNRCHHTNTLWLATTAADPEHDHVFNTEAWHCKWFVQYRRPVSTPKQLKTWVDMNQIVSHGREPIKLLDGTVLEFITMPDHTTGFYNAKMKHVIGTTSDALHRGLTKHMIRKAINVGIGEYP